MKHVIIIAQPWKEIVRLLQFLDLMVFVITYSHSVRVEMNNTLLKSWVAFSHSTLFEIRAAVTLPFGISLTNSQRKSLNSLWTS